MDERIVIPSYRRSSRLMDNLGTLDAISPRWRDHTDLFVRSEEAHLYAPVADWYGVNIVSFTPRFSPFGWGNTMDAIFDMYTERYDRFVTMDDDLRFYYRPNLGAPVPMNAATFDEMMEALLSTEFEYPLAGILPRQFCIKFDKPIEYNFRLMQVFSVYSEVFRGQKYRFSQNGPFFMSDVFFTLNTLQHGIKNKVYCRFVRNDLPNTPGGCIAAGRNPETHAESVRFLKKAFPHLVEITHPDKEQWEGYLGTKISWKKAYKAEKP